MDLTQLRTPILADGIQSIHFFNGRLLSAEDLSQEQAANLQARRLLGKAIGHGVAYGLEVKQSVGISTNINPVVRVSAGLALNREGTPLPLKSQVDIRLVRQQETGRSAVTALFADCQPLQKGPYVTGKGVYLLTIQAASGMEGKAPVSGLGNLDAACNAKYTTDGVQFRLIQVVIPPAELDQVLLLRSTLAHRCFGTGDSEITSFFANPFGPLLDQYGLLDALRKQACLLDDEVPLALIYWTLRGGIEFVDMWSVRRRITQLSADPNWRLLSSDRTQTESEAAFLQFEDHIRDIQANEASVLNSIRAVDRFKFLPAAGLLPIAGTNSPSGFNWRTFFGNLAPDSLDVMDGALLPSLIRESFNHRSFSVSNTSMSPLTLYRIRENVDAVESGNAAQLVVVFASSAMRYSGVPRFDFGGFDISHFG